MIKTPILGLKQTNLPAAALLICGEETDLITTAVKEAGYSLIPIGQRRESASFRIQKGNIRLSLITTGFGSASVAGTMHELVMLGAKDFVMTGTCGGSLDYELGEVVFLDQATINPLGGPGATGFYGKIPPGTVLEPSKRLGETARRMELRSVSPGMIISQDVFYGFGCLLDDEGRPIYRGPQPEEGRGLPPGFLAFRELYHSSQPYLLDMETAFFYALCEQWEGVQGVALRGVSNYVPFNPENYISREKAALEAAVAKSLELLEMLEG